MSQENVEAVRGSLEGWIQLNIDAWIGSPHPDIEFQTSGVYPGVDPTYRGIAGLRRFWTTFREPWESLQIHIDQVLDLGDEVLVLGTFEGRARDGMTVEREVAWIFRFVDGLVARTEGYAAWKEALEAAGLEE